MAFDQVMPGRFVRWISATEPDWDAVYAEELPRVYNFFRYRFGQAADAEDLTARTFEKSVARQAPLSARPGWVLDVAVQHCAQRGR